MTSLIRRDHAPSALADGQLVDGVVGQIRDLWRQGLLATVVAVGDCLIERFFDSSLELAASHAPVKESALRQLYKRVGELPIGLHQLRLAVRVAVQWHRMPRELADGLTTTQHEALLPLDDVTTKDRLAREAIAERLSAEQLQRRVRRIKPRHGGGRPRTSPAVLWVRAVGRAAVETGRAAALADPELARLPTGDVKLLAADLRRARAEVDAALAACTRRLRKP